MKRRYFLSATFAVPVLVACGGGGNQSRNNNEGGALASNPNPAPRALASNENPVPQIVPALQQWIGGVGAVKITNSSRIVVASSALMDVASALGSDLKSSFGLVLAIVANPTTPVGGDIYLSMMDTKNPQIGTEGYLLNVDSYVSVSSNTETGVFYGTQSLLQILNQESYELSIPCGSAVDYPAFASRGLMLDVGRKYWSTAYLVEKIRRMAWMKLNTLHLHFNDWTAFRLQLSDSLALAALDDFAISQNECYGPSDIQEIFDAALKYHVMIIPEIDVPAHGIAKPVQALYGCPEPELSHSGWRGGFDGGWMLDIRRQDVVDHIGQLITYVIQTYFSNNTVFPKFSIGGDEYDFNPDLGLTGQTSFDFISKMNEIVKGFGKTTKAWQWNDYAKAPTPALPSDIEIDVWLSAKPEYNDNPTIGTEDGRLYCSPGLRRNMDPTSLYGSPLASTSLINGYKVCVWADDALNESDKWFEAHMQAGVNCLAEMTWGRVASASYAEFAQRVLLVGNAPGSSVWTDEVELYAQTLPIDDFRNGALGRTNLLNLTTGTVGTVNVSDSAEGPFQWNNPRAYWFTTLGALDASKFQTLNMAVHGALSGEHFNIQLIDSFGRNAIVPVEKYPLFTNGAPLYFHFLKIPLSDFRGVNLTSIQRVSILFNHPKTASGRIYINTIELGRIAQA